MIHLYRSNQLEELCTALSNVIEEPAGSPIDAETIVVPSPSMQDWLSMELSRRSGISANVDFPFPHTLIEQVYLSIEGIDKDDKWLRSDQLLWRLMGKIGEDIDKPEFASVRGYLEEDQRGTRRFQLAKKIAGLFDKYSHFRPQMVMGWDKSPEEHWQASLWHSIISASNISHPAIIAQRIEQAIGSNTIDLEKLPRRVSLFGIPSLSPLYLNIFAMLSQQIDVHLFLLSPCREYWADIVDLVQRKKIARKREKTGEGFSINDLHIEIGNPLLSSLGRIGREFQFLLEDNECVQYEEKYPELFVDPGTETVLNTLNSDILNLRNRSCRSADENPLPVNEEDDSVSIHACHSPMREVEVLRDQLLNLFEKEKSLGPRDVVVMLPELETYTPYIEAVFGARNKGKAVDLPYTISDVRAADETPVVEAFLGVLELASTRVTAGEVTGLLQSTAIRDRFGLSAKNIETLENWVVESGIRWGIDAEHRKDIGQPAFENNSWRFGLDRMLLGIALPTGKQELWEGRLPCEMMEGASSHLLGKLAWFCDTLFDIYRELRQDHTISGWRDILLGITRELCSQEGDYAQQHQFLRRVIDRICGYAEESGFEEKISLENIHSLFSDRLQKRKTSPGRMGSGITFCAMAPMRSIPFRVVCLMGMNDGDYPDSGRALSFDLTRNQRQAGDRSSREEDRYCFLEAILSAQDKLIITYCGQSIRNNRKRPPSVVLLELLEVLSDSFDRSGKDASLDETGRREQWITRHPLQPFSSRYFDPEHDDLFSYSSSYFEGAQALLLEPVEQKPFFNSPLENQVEEDTVLKLDDLLRFFQSPCAAFLQNRLKILLQRQGSEIDGREPIDLNPLEYYQVGDAMLSLNLEGRSMEQITDFFNASGQIPPGTPGVCLLNELANEIEDFVETIEDLKENEELDALQVDLPIGPYRLQGSLRGIYPKEGLVRFGYQRFNDNRLLLLWIEHLVLCSIAPSGYPKSSTIVCRRPKDEGMHLEKLIEVSTPNVILEELLELYEIGRKEPLLLFPRSSSTYAQHLDQGDDDSDETAVEALQKARAVWEQSSGYLEPECEERVFSLLFREADPLDPKYPGNFGLQGEENRFETLFQKIFSPLQDHLETSE